MDTWPFTVALGLICYLQSAEANSTTETTSFVSFISSNVSSSSSETFDTTSLRTSSTPDGKKVRLCYQCSATSDEEPCVTDVAGMINSTTRSTYVKNCTDTNENFTLCMIQTVEAGGKIILYHRDCHDGKYFPTALNSSIFHRVRPNNLTTCDLIADKMVCYRPCNSDFCNGPQLPQNKTDPCIDYYKDPENNDDLYETCGALKVIAGNKLDTFLYLALSVPIFMIGWL